MRIAIDLSDEDAQRLRSVAKGLGIEPDRLAQAALADLLAQPQEDFRVAAEHVLRKNRDLYERLS